MELTLSDLQPTVRPDGRLPDATVARLPVYLRALHTLAENGAETVSSEELAAVTGVGSAKLRKDLSHLGSFGTRGVGYDVRMLVELISTTLGLNRSWPVALVGVGNLGHALAGYAGFASRGFRIAALLDADPATVGEVVEGLAVRHVDELPEVVAEHNISIGVITVPPAAAQQVADRLVDAGVRSILNFAPCVLQVPEGVEVRKVDLAIELQILSFHEHRRLEAAKAPTENENGDAKKNGVLPSSLKPSNLKRRALRRFPASRADADINEEVIGG
ncbi:redox-sensing transcriptional repressor Rex [Fodinicola feengrottensis]|uniref:Redox-sensing transcriptional repressor Rex n=1 Tax=Fodinicola feengrottensis TaxID=435914 RepID=A0ABN2FQ07_9ACTN